MHMNFFSSIFSRQSPYKQHLPFDNANFQNEIVANRATLAHISNWIDEKAFADSCFSYGVPEFIRKHINKPLNDDLTYTDLMVFLTKKYFSSPQYLEIGVSVGKNFFQMLNAGVPGKYVGFDIEEINPVLEKELHLRSKKEWEGLEGSIKKTRPSLKSYDFKGLDVQYMSADVWDKQSWAKLKGNSFNIIFSDALHTPEAILFEFEMLVQNGLLAEKFIIVWDDLVGKMKRSFFSIVRKYNKLFALREIYLLNINGWIGQYEAPHSIGIISNFSFNNEGSAD